MHFLLALFTHCLAAAWLSLSRSYRDQQIPFAIKSMSIVLTECCSTVGDCSRLPAPDRSSSPIVPSFLSQSQRWRLAIAMSPRFGCGFSSGVLPTWSLAAAKHSAGTESALW